MIKQILMIVFFVFIGTHFVTYVFQRQLIYIPTKTIPNRQALQAEDMQVITLKTDDGLMLNSWYKPAESAKPTILFLHGNAGNISNRIPLARHFIAEGYGVLLLEYRGYGGNQGQPTEQGLYQDGRAAMQFLQQNQVDSEHVVLYGESLGTGVATQLATEYSVCALVLQSPYTSLSAIARYHYPWIFISPWDKFDSFTRIRNIHVPLLVLHGTHDKVIPYAEGLALFNQANEPKQWVKLPNKDHNNLWDADFVRDVTSFINTRCGRTPHVISSEARVFRL